ncbi:30S ribosomal protein S8 [Neoehrlichia mikurensis]|uniref:Small ribosomal subunit protein uS8 n=1 Tax=Neoehrlichia mikurensis TaxID=89586 RepID=A0A9Q9F573_9RICK|nr:30S ribosomal protein S8 [Neoehrlichia mikurensis]QXK91804.1 30S ribosomal protein S8 [Neoehrlichia mikurensis]QXK93017.1 30S ribosomal protein S8 [Neoehrlichia mikurensis]QXK93495.1 30S ribosomal protein S8 [Neoehrlichia mikurensis]UTO55551.1 30S ribosomal protein S8 [Neoehrlichia mikurensis]UTO56472.1 30S ribosomal protein S8 [Neoehrlichia mikurensis]
MSLSDPIANFLTIIRNGQMAMNKVVVVPYSSVILAILKMLLSEGYIEEFTEEYKTSKIKFFKVRLKYFNYVPVIKKIIRISKPGKRVYFSAKKMPKFYNGLGIYIISTSRGIMLDYHARKLGIGGEVLCGVF